MADFYKSAETERKILESWKKKDVIKELNEKNRGGSKFYFLDGPPFVTNEIHEGTLLNLFLKDIILRHRLMKGFEVKMQPGWDTHGLPIEVAVEKKLGIKNKKELLTVGEEKFVEECKNYVEEYIKLNTSIITDYGLIWFYNPPYKTYENHFIDSEWGTIKKAYEMGLLYRGFKTTWFCTRCGTPMSNYEIRDKYYEKEDPSIYVLFELEDGRNLLIWTTTPWTLPSNEAVAVNSSFKYYELKIDRKTVIIAKDREKVLDEVSVKYIIEKELDGKDLLGLRYKPLFSDIPQVKENAAKMFKIIDGSRFTSEEGVPFVEIDEGTGLVHVAPGHGESDYKIGIENGLPLLSPVKEDGTYDESAGWLNGKNVSEANTEIIDFLEERGDLVAAGKVLHNYPHCWRCKTPLIMRASDQWFISVSKIRKELAGLLNGVNWTPEGARKMFEAWLSNSQDWVISRQRYWNTPLPIWQCETCKEITVVGSKTELLQRSNKKTVADLHKGTLDKIEIKCEKCGGVMRRVKDVIDVWIDSGSASFASIEDKGRMAALLPVDFICEGNDQIRGWFYSLLVIGFLFWGKAIYKDVLMHRFVVGEDGRKLSKSESNYKPPSQLIKEGYSRDALRMALVRHKLEDEVIFSLKGLTDETKSLNTVYNLGKLFQSSKVFFKRPNTIKAKGFKTEDIWMLSKWNTTKKAVDSALEHFRPDVAANTLMEFVINDFSRLYVKLVKDRIFDDLDEGAFVTFYAVLEEMLAVLSIFTPFIAEDTWKAIGKKGSTLLSDFPSTREDIINAGLEKNMDRTTKIVQDVLSARDKLKLPLRRPLKKISLLSVKKEDICEDVLKKLVNAASIEYRFDENAFDIGLNFEALRKKHSPQELTSITSKFIELTKETILRHAGSVIELVVDDKKYSLLSSDLNIKAKSSGVEVVSGDQTQIALDTSADDSIMSLWLQREIVHAIQNARKEFGLSREDKINVEIAIDGRLDAPEIKEIANYVKDKTNSSLSKSGSLMKTQDLKIGNKNVVLSIFR